MRAQGGLGAISGLLGVPELDPGASFRAVDPTVRRGSWGVRGLPSGLLRPHSQTRGPGGSGGRPQGCCDPAVRRGRACPLQLEERRDSMLETARHCFTSAARCEGDGDEEEWLIHYMLGKVAEKQQQPPPVYLRHYGQASHLLHEEAARYPKKIHYHNPPELAMEALEVGCAGPGGRALPSQRPSPPGCSQSLLGSSVSPALQLQALVPAACSLGARRGSQLGHGGAEELRPSGPLGHGLACSSQADCAPCLGVRVGSGGTLGVLPGAHVVHEAGSKDMVQA